MRNRLFLPILRGAQMHPLYYAFWFFLFIMGISCGFHTISLLGKTDLNPITASLNTWIGRYVYHERNSLELLLSSLLSNGSWMLLLIFAGIFRFGSLFLFAVPALKGFGVGSFAGMMSVCHGTGGLLFAVLILFLQNALLLPCFIHTGAFALTQIQTNHRLKFNRHYLFPTFIFFGAAVIMDCSIVPWVVGLLGSTYV